MQSKTVARGWPPAPCRSGVQGVCVAVSLRFAPKAEETVRLESKVKRGTLKHIGRDMNFRLTNSFCCAYSEAPGGSFLTPLNGLGAQYQLDMGVYFRWETPNQSVFWPLSLLARVNMQWLPSAMRQIDTTFDPQQHANQKATSTEIYIYIYVYIYIYI